MTAAAEAPSVSLGAPRAPARHCGAPAWHCGALAATALLGAADMLGPLSLVRKFLGETRPCFRDAVGMLPRVRRGSQAGRSEDQLARRSGSACWHQEAVGQGPACRVSELACCSLEAAPDFLQHPCLMLRIHKTQY